MFRHAFPASFCIMYGVKYYWLLNKSVLLHPIQSNQLNVTCSPGRYFLWKLVTVVLIQTAWQDSFTWPLVIFLLSCCIYPLASSCAHTFSTMSERARHICFFFDYGALSFYSLGKCMWFTRTQSEKWYWVVLFYALNPPGTHLWVKNDFREIWQLSQIQFNQDILYLFVNILEVTEI